MSRMGGGPTKVFAPQTSNGCSCQAVTIVRSTRETGEIYPYINPQVNMDNLVQI